MTRNARTRYWLAVASRGTALGVHRSSEVKKVVDKTGLSSGEPCGIRLRGLMYPGGDYWV